MKPYHHIEIRECGEPLVPINCETFAVLHPHPYVALGAPYGDASPYFLRQDVCDRLGQAQRYLSVNYPGWRIQIFDAYRPIPVQQFMVEHAYGEILEARGLTDAELSDVHRQALREEVYQFWAVPSPDPQTPPPHSTGAALDVTLVNEIGNVLNMGSPIDELSPRSFPDYFAPESPHRPATDLTPPSECDRAHQNRRILYRAMRSAGFQRHPQEWWHFSFGDQLWAWLTRVEQGQTEEGAIARYGRV